MFWLQSGVALMVVWGAHPVGVSWSRQHAVQWVCISSDWVDTFLCTERGSYVWAFVPMCS